MEIEITASDGWGRSDRVRTLFVHWDFLLLSIPLRGQPRLLASAPGVETETSALGILFHQRQRGYTSNFQGQCYGNLKAGPQGAVFLVCRFTTTNLL
jgi:hypothetical protein